MADPHRSQLRRRTRTEFQVRNRLLTQQRGAWDCAADWTPVWVGFGPSWRSGDEPLPWAAHKALWNTLDAYAEHVRFRRRLGGVTPLLVQQDVARKGSRADPK